MNTHLCKLAVASIQAEFTNFQKRKKKNEKQTPAVQHKVQVTKKKVWMSHKKHARHAGDLTH